MCFYWCVFTDVFTVLVVFFPFRRPRSIQDRYLVQWFFHLRPANLRCLRQQRGWPLPMPWRQIQDRYVVQWRRWGRHPDVRRLQSHIGGAPQRGVHVYERPRLTDRQMRGRKLQNGGWHEYPRLVHNVRKRWRCVHVYGRNSQIRPALQRHFHVGRSNVWCCTGLLRLPRNMYGLWCWERVHGIDVQFKRRGSMGQHGQ